MKQSQQEEYTQDRADYQLVMPLALGVKIGEDEQIRLMNRIMEGMDYSELKAGSSYWDRYRKATPRHLAKVIVF